LILKLISKYHILSKLYFLFYLIDKRKKIVLRNLEIAFPELSEKEKTEIAKKSYKNFLLFFEDANYLNKEVIFKNGYFLENLIKNNEKIILFSAHLGNFEIVSKLIAQHFKLKMCVVMREMKSKKINDYFVKIRTNEYVTMLFKHSAKEMLKALKANMPVGLLIDQNYNRTKTQVKFFYKKTYFNDAISKLAKPTGAYVLPVFCYLEGDKYIIEFKEPKKFEGDIKSFTQWQANEIEEMIRKYPSQYFWFHRRWKRTHEY